MASKFILLAALVATVQGGGPAAYSISAPSIDGAYVGSSQEHTVKGHYGQNSLSQYTKAVDSAHSSVRVSSSRASNDVLGYAPGYAGHAIAAPALAAPAVKIAPAYAGHGLGLGYAGYGHGYAGLGHGYAGYGHGYAAPAYAAHAVAAPALAGYAAAHQYGTHLTGAPAIKYATAPAYSVAHGGAYLGAYGHGYAAPLAHSPLAVKTAVAAAPIVHSSFVGHGAHYAY